MLTAATLGMVLYALYAVIGGVVDLITRSRMEVVADLGQVAFGLMLLLAAAFVRVLIPGGLALAIGALLGLQALSIHGDIHVLGTLALAPQIVRGGYAAMLVVLAFLGARQAGKHAPGDASGLKTQGSGPDRGSP